MATVNGRQIDYGFDYDGSAVPSSPAAGQTWRERANTGQIKKDWEYIGSLGKWQSLQEYAVSMSRIFTATGQYASPNIDIYSADYSIRLVRLNYMFTPTITQDTNAYYSLVSRDWSDTVDVAAVINTQGVAANTFGFGVQNLDYVFPSDKEAPFFLRSTRVGTAGNVDLSITYYYRHER